jgi:hypothetical protein
MHVGVQLEFKADRKEPLGDLVRRVATQFDRSGLQPEILATFSDGPAGTRNTSAVERAIRTHRNWRASSARRAAAGRGNPGDSSPDRVAVHELTETATSFLTASSTGGMASRRISTMRSRSASLVTSGGARQMQSNATRV